MAHFSGTCTTSATNFRLYGSWFKIKYKDGLLMEVCFRDFEDSSSSKTNEKLAHEKKSLRLSLIFLSKSDSGENHFPSYLTVNHNQMHR